MRKIQKTAFNLQGPSIKAAAFEISGWCDYDFAATTLSGGKIMKKNLSLPTVWPIAASGINER